MSDFNGEINQEESTTEVQSQEQSVEKVKIGEEEYTQDELRNLVGLGKTARDVESRYNTKIDRVWPEYGRSQTKVKELEKELESIRREKTNSSNNTMDEGDKRKALDAAKNLGIVTTEDFKVYLEKEFKDIYKREREADKLVEEVRSLEKQIDGKDGRPTFKGEVVLSHMERTGIQSPERAYKDLYEKEIDTWKMQQFSKGKRPGMVTQSGGGSYNTKAPAPVKVTKDNLGQLLNETLFSGFTAE